MSNLRISDLNFHFTIQDLRMKATILFLAIIGFAVNGSGQYNKWVIRFTDKNNSPYGIDRPADFLSAKAIARRVKHNITVDAADLPVNPNYIQQVLAKGAVQYLSESKWLNQVLIYCDDNTVIDAINTLPFVLSSKPAGLIKPQNPGYESFKEKITPLGATASRTNNTMQDTLDYGNAYNQVQIHNGQFLHNKGFTGNGITIAVLDAGFYHYRTLSAFDSIRINNQVLGERDFVDYDNSVDEDNAHGMYCLSTIGANKPGVMVGTAPHASFWLLRSENEFTEFPIEEHSWVAAAEFADSAGADMISSSLGYNYFNDPSFNHSYADIYANTTTVSQGAAIAARKGMIVTNSAGNEGGNAWKYLIFPADADSVCSVGAVNTGGQIASFSSYGYPGKVKPNIVSVGSGTTVFGTNNFPVTGSGTSFSNPNINGLIACLWQAFPAYNNMAILNAVYQSANKYSNPDNRYGFGIPNMKSAYVILKKTQNTALYGTGWLFATPNPFTNRITVKLIGQIDGNAQIALLDPGGKTIAQISLITEQQEVYDTAFINLDNLPGGTYSVKYTDSISTKTIELKKNGVVMKDWLTAVPVPFTTELTAYLAAPETGKASLRLIDVLGRIIETKELTLVQNNFYQVSFSAAKALAKGVYFIQYIGAQKKTVKVIK